MDSSVRCSIKDDLLKADECYVKGKYHNCVRILQTLQEIVHSTSLLEMYGLDEHVVTCLIENNILLSKSMTFSSDLHYTYEKWNDIMENFIKLHQEMKSLQTVYKVPLVHYLNVAHNTLWWGWRHPNDVHCDESHFETCVQVAIDCFRKVLEICNDSCPTSSFCDSKDVVLHTMRKLSNILLQLCGEESLLLLEIYAIVIYIIIEAKPNREVINECISIVTFLLDLRTKLPSCGVSTINITTNTVSWKSNFKFGFHVVNSEVGKSNVKTVLEILKMTCCICFIQVEQYAKCVEYLDILETEVAEFQLIQLYVKAYACYRSNDLEACLFYISKLENRTSSTYLKARYHLLHGSLLAKKGQHYEALLEFFKPLSIGLQDVQERKDFYPITLYFIAEEYEALCQIYQDCSQTNVDEQNNKRTAGSQRTELLPVSLRADHLDTLQHLVQVLKEDDESTTEYNTSIFNFELRMLNILHPQPEINLPVALYKLASRLAADGDNIAAAELFVKLLTQKDLQPLSSLVTQLPHISIIYHNTVTLLLRSNELQQAEQLCKKAISYHSSKSYNPKEIEHYLLCMEDDLVALMLMAKLYKLKREDIPESEMLDRCLGITNNFKSSSLYLENKEIDLDGINITQFLNALEAKLHLQKALNYMERGYFFKTDTFHEFRQAILCSPDDEDVITSYKLFLEENNQFHDKDRRMPKKPRIYFNIENCNSLALKYLLQAQPSEDNSMDLFMDS